MFTLVDMALYCLRFLENKCCKRSKPKVPKVSDGCYAWSHYGGGCDICKSNWNECKCIKETGCEDCMKYISECACACKTCYKSTCVCSDYKTDSDHKAESDNKTDNKSDDKTDYKTD